VNAKLARTTRIVLVAITLGACANAFAGQELLEVDSQFRARIAKEKIKIGAQQRKAEEEGKTQDQGFGNNGFGNTSCGSQSIGNIDTGGRIGAAPREVFVFAPNAINLVGRGGCQ
jgi:hypothetical protein